MNLKKLALLSALAVTLTLGLMMFGGRKARAAGPTCTVPGTYSTIQAAVNDPGCTTINVVAPGSYSESVTIGRPLTLNGPNAGASALGPRAPEAIVKSPGTTLNLTNGQGVTIDGLFIKGDFGVYVSGSTTGTVIQNNILEGQTRSLTLDSPGDGASVLNNQMLSEVRSLHVSGGPYTNLKVNGNLFQGSLASTGIFFSGRSANTITGFDFKNNLVQHWANMASTITNGTLSGNAFSVVGGIQIDLHNSTMAGNSFDGGNATECIQLFGSQFGLVPSDHVTISGNTFNNCYRYGVQLSPDIHAITITGNQFTNGAGDGVDTRQILDDDTGDFVGLWDVTGKEIHINLNNITGNLNFGVNNTVNGILDATCNWWGAANGPGPVGPGSGDRVSNGVNFTPWNVAPAPGGACTGCPTPGCTTNRKDCHKFVEQQEKDFNDQQKADDKAFDDKQKADKKAFDATHPSPQAKKAFDEDQKAKRKAFDDKQKSDKEAFQVQYKANEKQCEMLPNK